MAAWEYNFSCKNHDQFVYHTKIFPNCRYVGGSFVHCKYFLLKYYLELCYISNLDLFLQLLQSFLLRLLCFKRNGKCNTGPSSISIVNIRSSKYLLCSMQKISNFQQLTNFYGKMIGLLNTDLNQK